MELDLANWKPEIDTFLDFKNRIARRLENGDLFDKSNPDFAPIFKKMMGIIHDNPGDMAQEGMLIESVDEEKRRKFTEFIIGFTSLVQYHHEMFIRIPESFHKLRVEDDMIALAMEYLFFNTNKRVFKSTEIQERYYLVLPMLERIFENLKARDNIFIEELILLILVYKIYTSALQKNKFLDDVEDLFILYVENLDIFDTHDWKNPLLDNFHRMIVQVGLMLKQTDLVLETIKHRLHYLASIKKKLVHKDQEPNLILNIINVNFSISKNYLQLSDTKNHEINLTLASQWLDSVMEQFPFTKKAWKLKTKMIRSSGHNALKRSAYEECYSKYLLALVYAYNHKLPKEYDRAIMYVNKYRKFFKEEHVNILREGLKEIPNTLSKTHLLFLLGKVFSKTRQLHISVHIQTLMVEILEEAYESLQLELAIGTKDKKKKEHFEKVKNLYAKNLDFLGNILNQLRNPRAAIKAYEREAEIYNRESPKKTIRILMKIAKELSRHSRYREAIEHAEHAFHLASEFLIKDQIERILQFLIKAAKMGDQQEKLANYKKLLYQV